MQEYTDQGKPKSNNKMNRRRLRFLLVVFLCFIAWACVTLLGQVDHLSEKKMNLIVLKSKLADTQKANQDIKNQITRLNDSEYIEQKVRQEYHYTKPGDLMFMPGLSDK